MPMLKAENISISFGGLKAVDGVSFQVAPGEIKGLIGPNGAGKTTVLNLISGIYRCDTGRVWLDGKDVTDLPPYVRAQRGLGRSFQTPRFLQRSTIRENMQLGTDLADQMGGLASFFGKRGYSFDDEIEEMLDVIKFHPDWEDDIEAVPYGQRKQLEIIRTLLAHPKAILIDEPAAGLTRKELEHSVALLRHAAANGVSIILIEHAMEMVMNVCDSIVVLNFGKLIADGTPAEVSANEQVIEAYLGRD